MIDGGGQSKAGGKEEAERSLGPSGQRSSREHDEAEERLWGPSAGKGS